MRKADGSKALTDEENAEVFCVHFHKIFNNLHPLPCDIAALDLIALHPTHPHLAHPPTVDAVRAALRCMANGKVPGPSSVTSDALKSMTWTEPDPEEAGTNNDAEFLVGTIHAMLVNFWVDSLNFES
eukprot:11724795-Ditylum_brightwellii.AAC.1